MKVPKPKNKQKLKTLIRKRRERRVRSKIKGTKYCPRLSVFRSLNHIYTQLIDDEKNCTLVSVSDLGLKSKSKQSFSKKAKSSVPRKDMAYKVGELLAKEALAKKIQKVVFDKSWYKYHGRVKALAEGARAGGLQF